MRLPLFPCLNRPGTDEDKRPRVRWQDWATTDFDKIRQWWKHPLNDDLIAVVTGARSGIAVLDPDPRNDGHLWLRENEHLLPTTRIHDTRQGGWHYLFRYPDGLRNGKIVRGVDVKGEGGYFIWWPAFGYPVRNAIDIAQLPVWPEFLKPIERPLNLMQGQGYVIASRHRIELQARFVAGSTPGCNRNSNLFTAACRVAEMWFHRDEDRDAAFEQLIEPAMALGLERRECERTIQSAIERVARDQEQAEAV
jgi:hypothetical protein